MIFRPRSRASARQTVCGHTNVQDRRNAPAGRGWTADSAFRCDSSRLSAVSRGIWPLCPGEAILRVRVLRARNGPVPNLNPALSSFGRVSGMAPRAAGADVCTEIHRLRVPDVLPGVNDLRRADIHLLPPVDQTAQPGPDEG